MEATTLDNYFSGKQPPDLLWVDVEGAELQVLQGAANILNHVKLIHIEVSFRPMQIGKPLFWKIEGLLAKEELHIFWAYGSFCSARLLLSPSAVTQSAVAPERGILSAKLRQNFAWVSPQGVFVAEGWLVDTFWILDNPNLMPHGLVLTPTEDVRAWRPRSHNC